MIKDFFQPLNPHFNYRPQDYKWGKKPFPDRNVHYLSSLSRHKMTSTPKNNFSFLKKIPKEIGIQTPEKFDPHYKEITRLELKLTETESQIETIKHNLQNKRIFSQSPDKYKSKSYKILNDPISSNDVDKSKSPLSNMGKQIMKIDNRSYRYSPTF